MEKIYSITEINERIKNFFDQNFQNRQITLEGEIIRFKYKPEMGIAFFELTDTKANISATLFENHLNKINFKPKDGDKVIAVGILTVRKKSCLCNLIVHSMQLKGAGERLILLENLKKKLKAEGIFEHKREINIYPDTIGIITAKDSAAYKDFITEINERYPLVKVYFFNALTQGQESPKSLINALEKAYQYKLDTIIIGRGGGSSTDLDAFNDENLARVAFKSPYPIISAVGHSIDKTIIDYVADKDAITPTAAIQFATANQKNIFEGFNNIKNKLCKLINEKIFYFKEVINSLKKRQFFRDPCSFLIEDINLINEYKKNINNQVKLFLKDKTNFLKVMKEKIQVLNSQNILKRGFALLKNSNGEIIKEIKNVKINDQIETILHDGKLYVNVIKKVKNNG